MLKILLLPHFACFEKSMPKRERERRFKNKSSFPRNNWLTDFTPKCNTVTPLLERGVLALEYLVVIKVILNSVVNRSELW